MMSIPPPPLGCARDGVTRIHGADCACRDCNALDRGPADAPPPFSWRARAALFAAGLLAGQLILIVADPWLHGPGPFAWIGIFQ